MANFGPLLRGQPYSPNFNHCILHIRPKGHREPCGDYTNNHPISLLSNIEKLMYKRLYTFLNKNVIYNLQFGFKQQWHIQRVLDAGIPVWVPKLCAQIIEKCLK